MLNPYFGESMPLTFADVNTANEQDVASSQSETSLASAQDASTFANMMINSAINSEAKENINDNAEIDDNLLCFIATSKAEEKFGIEKHLLSTIASVESGKWDYEREQFMAWPWTVNAQGNGYYFDSKEAAIKKVRELQAEGVESIDVGCMQINLKFHKDAFDSLEDAFDPQKNVEYSAKFLNKLYSSRGNDWKKAAMAYHSKIPSKGHNYKLRLDSRYEQLSVALASPEFNVF